MNEGIEKFVYYSLERPTLVAPVGEVQSFRSFAREVDDALRYIFTTKSDLLDSAKWGFFVSAGKPQGPLIARKRNGNRREVADILPYQEAPEIQNDYKPQMGNARKRQWLISGIQIFAKNKWGFMGAFVRLSSSAPRIKPIRPTLPDHR